MTPHIHEAEREQAAQFADLSQRQREYQQRQREFALRNSPADNSWRLLNISPKPIDNTLSPFTSEGANIVND